MADELRRTVISPADSPVYEVRIDLPRSVKEAISESIERGKQAAREQDNPRTTTTTKRVAR
jgi:hypothetical protein